MRMDKPGVLLGEGAGVVVSEGGDNRITFPIEARATEGVRDLLSYNHVATWKYAAYIIRDGKGYLQCRIDGAICELRCCDKKTRLYPGGFYLCLASGDGSGAFIDFDSDLPPSNFPYTLERLYP